MPMIFPLPRIVLFCEFFQSVHVHRLKQAHAAHAQVDILPPTPWILSSTLSFFFCSQIEPRWELLTNASSQPHSDIDSDDAVIVHVLSGGQVQRPSTLQCDSFSQLW